MPSESCCLSVLLVMEQSIGLRGAGRCLRMLYGALLFQRLSGLLAHGLPRGLVRHREPLIMGALVGPDIPTLRPFPCRHTVLTHVVARHYAAGTPTRCRHHDLFRPAVRTHFGFAQEPTPLAPDGRTTGQKMAIADIAAYTHLSEADVEALGRELDAIRDDIEESLGERDAAYIRRTIKFQRTLDLVARLLIGGSRSRTGLAVGAASLAFAKSIENMEIGHNVSHGQWDWMNDPEIHSSTWEWDMVAVSSQWRYSHNYRHHVFSNVVGVDDDLGFGIMRVSRDERWKPAHLVQPLRNLLLASIFEWGIGLHGVHSERDRVATDPEKVTAARAAFIAKIARQTVKDYVLFPALSRSRWRRTLVANVAANLARNLWTYIVIFCG